MRIAPVEEEKDEEASSPTPRRRSPSCGDKCFRRGIIYKIIKKHCDIKKENSIFYSYLILLTSVYFSCEALQVSPLIKSSDHYNTTVSSFAYDLLFSWLISYFLLSQQKIATQNIPDNIFYWIMAHIGGLGFALLGEVPFLSHLVITNTWWKGLDINAWITIIIFAVIIISIGIKETIDSCFDNTFKTNLRNIFIIGVAYTVILILLYVGNSKYIHFHVHHAIFAGVLSTWFTKWDYKIEMAMHAIFMGIVVEGINFYGIGELALFLTNGVTLLPFSIALSITLFYIGTIGLCYLLSYW